MDRPSHVPPLPPGSALAVTDGGVGKRGASAGLVLVHDGMATISGTPLPGMDDAWDAEVASVSLAVDAAIAAGATRLRLLIDRYDVARFVQGRRPTEPRPRDAALDECTVRARSAGLALSARVVQGHTETADLPSRLNHVAHVACDIGLEGRFELRETIGPEWLDGLAARDKRFRRTRTHLRWVAELQRGKVAHFLGVDVATVDALLAAGHLDIGSGGVTRRSAARVYEVAQAMRLDGFFGFGEPEGVPGHETDEICRGWDGRPSGFLHRKAGTRVPPPGEHGDTRHGDTGHGDVPSPTP